MRKITTQQEYIALIEELKEHDKHYYEECKPVISDYEYDQLLKLVEAFEKEYPELVALDSPTKRVGEEVSKGFLHVEHRVQMLSLANTYSEEELKDFVERVYRLLEKKEVAFCAELKIDGTALSLRYEKGYFVRALTRGTGKVGDDVTSNVRTIKTLPLKLQGAPDLLEIRGEVFMSKKSFQELNEEREESGEDLWANPRNAAAGSLKLLDPKEVARRKLNVLCYGIAEGLEMSSQFELLHYLKKIGLPTAKEEFISRCHSLEEIIAFAKKVEKMREELPFEIDGIVIKVDALQAQKLLGVTGKTPRYAVAYKFAPEQAYTQIREITVQVGRTGVLTPVAELEPVFLAGSTISRATLHNEDEVRRKDIREKDFVLIEKGGDVIPKVVSVDFAKRKESNPWHMPKNCPSCGHEVEKKEGEVAVRCSNPKCFGKRLRYLIFFASKAAMDIENLGPKVMEQLVEKGLVKSVSDIYTLTAEGLSHMEGFKEKSIQNLLESIDRSKKCFLSRFLVALEIPHVGTETAYLLATTAKDLPHLMEMQEEELKKIEGIGDIVAESIARYFRDPRNQEEIRLLLHHIEPQKEKVMKVEHPFKGKTFVLTGTLKNYSRDEASLLIKERGGKTSSSVSKNTGFVLAGEDPGSKYETAKKLKVPILTEEEFTKLLR